MAATIEEIERDIREAIAAGFRRNLLARGQARSMIWRDGQLPDGAPPFSSLLSYNLLSYGYSLLSMGIRLLELEGNLDIARLAFEHAAGAIEAVIAKGDARDEARGFHHIVAASAYHLGRFSAHAYSLLVGTLASANISPIERCLALLMVRDLDALYALIASWRQDGIGSDTNLVSLLQGPIFTGRSGGEGDNTDYQSRAFDALDLAITDNFMGAIAVFLLALERGEANLVAEAVGRLHSGLSGCAEMNFVPQWWIHRLAIYLIGDLWTASFHIRLPLIPDQSDAANWAQLREIFIALLHRRKRAEIELWPSQLSAAARAIDAKDDLVISLPTSAGKTRIAEFCILRCLSAGKRAIFVTPLRALSAQTEVSLQRTFLPLGKTISTLYGSIGTSDFEQDALRKRDIVVATPEKLDFALRNDPSLLNDVGLIVLDEGHMIGIDEREVRYEAQIQRLLKRVDAEQRRIVCLSAILPSGEQLEDFANWLTRDHPGSVVRDSWRPTRLRYGEVVWNGESARLNIQVGAERPWVPNFFIARVPPKGQRKSPFPRDQREFCLATTWRLVEEGQSVLIYCPLRASVEPFARAIVDLNRRGLLRSVLQSDGRALATAFAIGREWLGDNHPILECLKLGVAIHHGALPTPFRKEVERLLRNGVLKITVSSPTLAQGLNLSATSIVIHSLMRNKEVIESSEFRNVAGRAGRAYVDVEGLVVHPMFDDLANRRMKWQRLIANEAGREMESGLYRLVITLLNRMQRKIGEKSLDRLVDYVMNNSKAWQFAKLQDESKEEAAVEATRWEQFLTNLDTAILSLMGEQEVQDEDIELKLDEILASSLLERRLARRNEATRIAVKSALHSRAKFIWTNSTPTQRRGYFLAGVGLNTGQQLDAMAVEVTALLVQANGAILNRDEPLAIKALTSLAEKIFSVSPFIPKPLPGNWRTILEAWLQGTAILEVAGNDEDEVLRFVEGGLIYRLPWGIEAIRVRGVANGDSYEDGLTLADFELGLAAAAVETGTLNRSAALLMQAGFTSRLSAIKVVHDSKADFTDGRALREWLGSPTVAALSEDSNWPTPETAEIWSVFRESFSPAVNRVWRHRTYDVPLTWADKQATLVTGAPAHAVTAADGKQTLILSPDFELAGSLVRPLNPARVGLLLATVNTKQTDMHLDYFGPNDLFAG